MRSPPAYTSLVGIPVGIAIYFIERFFPGTHICIVTFFLVGAVISVFPPLSVSKDPSYNRQSMMDGMSAIMFMGLAFASYLAMWALT